MDPDSASQTNANPHPEPLLFLLPPQEDLNRPLPISVSKKDQSLT